MAFNSNGSTVQLARLCCSFLTSYADGKEIGPCPLLNVGDEFIFEGSAKMPDGFCPWAWIDIYRSISSMSSGSTCKPWNKRDGQTIVCCTDGIRPVVFNVEAIGEKLSSIE